MSRFDPLARARDFTFGPHPRRGQRPDAWRLSDLEQRVTALPAVAPPVSPLQRLLNVLPDPESYRFGDVVTVQGAAGQPSESYVLGQDSLDVPVWQPLDTGRPIRFDFWQKFGSTGSGAGQFTSPTSAIANASYLWIGDYAQGRIQRFTHDGAWVSTHGPSATLADNPNPLGYDFANRRIGVAGLDSASPDGFQVWPDDFSARVFQTGSTGTGNGQFQTAFGLGADSAGNWYVVDISNSRVQKFNRAGTYQAKWGSAGSGNGQFNTPTLLCVDENDGIYVADQGNYRIQKFDTSGNFLLSFGGQGNGPGKFPGQPIRLASNRNGLIFVVHSGGNVVHVFSTAGDFITRFGRDDLGFVGQSNISALAAYKNTVWSADATLDNVHIWRAGGIPSSGLIYVRQDADYTGSNVNTAQKIFDESANGRVTLPAGGVYLLDAAIHVHTTGTTSHDFRILFSGGTATFTSFDYLYFATLVSTEVGSTPALGWFSAATENTLTVASASATHHTVLLKGVVAVNAGGTFLPQYRWSAAPGVAGVTLRGSRLTLTPIAGTVGGSWD